MISFFQNSNYAIRTNMEYIYGQVIAPGENLSYTINLYIYQDTPVLQFEIDLMADNYYNHLSMQLNTQMQGGTDMTAIITYVGGGAGAAGIAVVTVKMVRGMKNKKQNKKDPNEPKPGDDREGNNSDVEFLF